MQQRKITFGEKNWRCWSKISDVGGLVTTTGLNIKVSVLVKKAD